MSGLSGALRALIGLFIDDGALALSVVAVCVATAFVAAIMPGSLLAGALLVFGCLAVLLANVLRAARR